jgi:hypothetical protein
VETPVVENNKPLKATVISEEELTDTRVISIYRDPVLVTHHFALYLAEETAGAVQVAMSYTRVVTLVASLFGLYLLAYMVPNPLQLVGG